MPQKSQRKSRNRRRTRGRPASRTSPDRRACPASRRTGWQSRTRPSWRVPSRAGPTRRTVSAAEKRRRTYWLFLELRPKRAGAVRLYATGILSPAPMQPEPLLRMLPNPAFDDSGDRLGCALNVDLAAGVADGGNFLGQLDTEAMVRKADDVHPVDRAFDLAEQPGQHRIGFGLAAEEGDLDAIGQVLVDQHADMLAVAERFGKPQRRVASGRDQRSHLHLPHLLDDAVGGGDIGPAIQDCRIKAV